MATKKVIYVFLGLPASGKGTQANILAERENLKTVSSGDLIRGIISANPNDPFVVDIKKRYDAGIPQPDEVVIDLFEKFLSESKDSVILDNFPFSLGQAEFLTNFLKQHQDDWSGLTIVYIDLDPEMAIKRAISRKICTVCGTIFGATDEMICEKCGGALIVRSDDNEETMRVRISHYLPRLNQLVGYYRNSTAKLIEIDGSKTVAEVTAKIEEKL
jgi:adenylate kinase